MPKPLEDPVVRSGRREAFWTFVLWAVAGIYSVGYCTLYGYDRSAESLTYVLWFPDWVFWGIVVPWLACALISTWFAIFYMEDDPLASTVDSPPEDDVVHEEAGR
jgi:hypothetical protein